MAEVKTISGGIPDPIKNQSSFSGLFIILTILATFIALVGNYIKPVQQNVEQLRARLEQVNNRAIQSDHLEEITSLSEQLKSVSKDIHTIERVENLHDERSKARLFKLEQWRHEDLDRISELEKIVYGLEIALERDYHRNQDYEEGGP